MMSVFSVISLFKYIISLFWFNLFQNITLVLFIIISLFQHISLWSLVMSVMMITCYVSYFEFSLSSHIILLIWLNNWLIHNVILSNFLIILTYFEIHHYFKVLSLYLNILSCFNFKNVLFQYNMSLCQVTISMLSRYFEFSCYFQLSRYFDTSQLIRLLYQIRQILFNMSK